MLARRLVHRSNWDGFGFAQRPAHLRREGEKAAGEVLQERGGPAEDRDRPGYVAGGLRRSLPDDYVLDKPMEEHSLTRAIARLNRVF